MYSICTGLSHTQTLSHTHGIPYAFANAYEKLYMYVCMQYVCMYACNTHPHTHMEYHTRTHAHRCTLTQLVPVVRSCDSEEGKKGVAQSAKVCMDCFSHSCAHEHKSTQRPQTHSAVSTFPSRTEERKQLTEISQSMRYESLIMMQRSNLFPIRGSNASIHRPVCVRSVRMCAIGACK